MNTLAQFESLLDLLGSRKTPAQISVEDWEGIVDQSLRHGVGTILLKRLEEGGEIANVPAEPRRKLVAEKLRIAVENTKLFVELAVVLNAFREENIPAVVLKGAHLSELVYGNISLRPMDDIDLLIKNDDLRKVEKKFAALGYLQSEDDANRMRSVDPHHLTPFRKEGCKPIEVHWTLPSMDAAGVEGFWERARRVEMAGCTALILSPEDLLIHLSVHASLHHRFGAGLRPLCDIAAAIDCYRDALDWKKLLTQARACGVVNATYLTLYVAHELVNADVSQKALHAMARRNFDPALFEWAKQQIYTRSKEISDPSGMSPRLARLLGSGSYKEKLRKLLGAAFPPRDQIAKMYSLSKDSLGVYVAYAWRWKDLLILRGGVVLRLLRRDKETLAKAEMYQKLVDEKEE